MKNLTPFVAAAVLIIIILVLAKPLLLIIVGCIIGVYFFGVKPQMKEVSIFDQDDK